MALLSIAKALSAVKKVGKVISKVIKPKELIKSTKLYDKATKEVAKTYLKQSPAVRSIVRDAYKTGKKINEVKERVDTIKNIIDSPDKVLKKSLKEVAEGVLKAEETKQKSIARHNKKIERLEQMAQRQAEREQEREIERLYYDPEKEAEKQLANIQPVKINTFYKANKSMMQYQKEVFDEDALYIQRWDENKNLMSEKEALLSFISDSLLSLKDRKLAGEKVGTGYNITNLIQFLKSAIPDAVTVQDPDDITTLNIDKDKVRIYAKEQDKKKREYDELVRQMDESLKNSGLTVKEWAKTDEFMQLNNAKVKLEGEIMPVDYLKKQAGLQNLSDEAKTILQHDSDLKRAKTITESLGHANVTMGGFQDLLNAAGPIVEDILTEGAYFHHFFTYVGYDSHQAKNAMAETNQQLLNTKLPESAIDSFSEIVENRKYDENSKRLDDWLTLFEMYYDDINNGTADINIYDELWKNI